MFSSFSGLSLGYQPQSQRALHRPTEHHLILADDPVDIFKEKKNGAIEMDLSLILKSAVVSFAVAVISRGLFAATPGRARRRARQANEFRREDPSSSAGKTGSYTQAIPRLKIPAVKMANGSLGISLQNALPGVIELDYGQVHTAHCAGIGLAATLESRYGSSRGEWRSVAMRGPAVFIFCSPPGVNICRVPQGGRNWEYYGEDPYLAGESAASLIRGVQSQEVLTTVNKFFCNDQEKNRLRDSRGGR